MNNIKPLAFALATLGVTSLAFAADNSVLIPSQKGGFKVGIDALYLRSKNADSNYATVILSPTNFPLGDLQNLTVDPSYDWGVYAQVGYLFPCTGNDLTLGYTHLNINDISSSNPGSTETAFVTVLPLATLLNDNQFASVEGKSESALNVVDLEAGQRFTTGVYDMRMFAGLRYANISASLKTFAYNASFPVSGTQDFNSQVKGIGPRMGVDARYCLSSGFGLDANLNTSLLVGKIDSHYNATGASGTVSTVTFISKNNSSTRIIPVLEAKLGGDYTYIVNPRCKSALVFEAGYQITNYFNAVDNTAVIDPRTATDFLSNGNTNKLAFDGLYLGVKYYA